AQGVDIRLTWNVLPLNNPYLMMILLLKILRSFRASRLTVKFLFKHTIPVWSTDNQEELIWPPSGVSCRNWIRVSRIPSLLSRYSRKISHLRQRKITMRLPLARSSTSSMHAFQNDWLRLPRSEER